MDSHIDMDNIYEQVSGSRRKERVTALINDFIAKGRRLLEEGKHEEATALLRDEVAPQLQKWGAL